MEDNANSDANNRPISQTPPTVNDVSVPVTNNQVEVSKPPAEPIEEDQPTSQPKNETKPASSTKQAKTTNLSAIVAVTILFVLIIAFLVIYSYLKSHH